MTKPIHISIALIRKIESEITRWLVIKNPASNQWEFIISQRLEKELGSQTLAREVAWRLELDRKTDFLVGKMAMLNVEIDADEFGCDRIDVEDLDRKFNADQQFPENDVTESESARIVNVEFIPVEVYRQTVLTNLDKKENVCWISSAEICDGKFALDKLNKPSFSKFDTPHVLQEIDPRFVAWNRKWKIIQPWVQ